MVEKSVIFNLRTARGREFKGTLKMSGKSLCRTARPSVDKCKSLFLRRFWLDSFTLVELLVVVAIIAVLISLLTPSLRSAREEAKMTACMNNLRQIGLGIILYGDERGVYPWGYEEAA